MPESDARSVTSPLSGKIMDLHTAYKMVSCMVMDVMYASRTKINYFSLLLSR